MCMPLYTIKGLKINKPNNSDCTSQYNNVASPISYMTSVTWEEIIVRLRSEIVNVD